MDLRFSAFNKLVSGQRDRQYAKNAAENYQKIKADFMKANYSMETLQGPPREAHFPALILGSGPSLDAAMPHLNRFNGHVFAAPSQLDILEKWEIIPKYVVAVDSADSMATEQIRSDHDFHGMTLLVHPYISPLVLDLWTGNRRYFHLKTDTDTHFSDVYPWIKPSFAIAGSTPNVMVQMAHYFGYNPIILAGVDYCFPGGRSRAQDYRKRGPYIFDPKPLDYVDSSNAEPGKTGTSQELMFYANLLLGIWKMYKMPLVQIGDQGAMTEIPFINPEDIGKIVEAPTIDDDKIIEIDKAMFSYGMHAEAGGDGIGRFFYRESDETAMAEADNKAEQAMILSQRWKTLEAQYGQS